MAHVTLMKVAAKAIHEKAFFEALMKNVNEALASVGWTLSEPDLARLTKALQSPPANAKVDVPKFLKVLHQQGFANVEWTAADWIDFERMGGPDSRP